MDRESNKKEFMTILGCSVATLGIKFYQLCCERYTGIYEEMIRSELSFQNSQMSYNLELRHDPNDRTETEWKTVKRIFKCY